ncbi:MAG: calcium-binding protein [Byssovorax sp.]
MAGSLGCTAEVVDGTGNDGGGGSGGGGGGAGICTSYIGDGCKPGEEQSCGYLPPEDTMTRHCKLVDEFCTTRWAYEDCNTPLVLSFDSAPVSFVADASAGFTVNGTKSLVTDWPTAATPWLAIDRDGSGRIEDGAELFGSMSPLASGGTAANGFVALRELDQNGDGQLTADDPAFAKLLVWSDRDADRSSEAGELQGAAAFRIVAIDLGYKSEPRCDARGNCEVERAGFRYLDAAGRMREGTVIDVHLAPQR